MNRRTVHRPSTFRSDGLALLGLASAVWLAAGCGPATGLPTAGPRAATEPATSASTAAEPTVPDPSADEPVTAAAWVSPGAVVPGSAPEVRVRVRVAAGHYLHSADAELPFVPTSVELVANSAVRPAGAWELTSGADADGRLSGSVEYRRWVRVADEAAAGSHELTCTLKYQACTPELCWPPRVLKLTAPFVVNATAVAAPNVGRTKETP